MGVAHLLTGGSEPGIENEPWRQAEYDLADHLRQQPDIESARVIGGVGGDGGKDVIAEGVDGTTYIAEAKHWAANKVHRNVVTGHAERHGTDGHELIVYAADNGFTEPARTAAENHGVRLLTADDLGRGGLADALRRSTPTVEQAQAAIPSTNLTSTGTTSRDAAGELGDRLGEHIRAMLADVDVQDLASRGTKRGARATGRGLRSGARLTGRALWKGTLRALGATRRVGTRALTQA
jgi:hypothetical protein